MAGELVIFVTCPAPEARRIATPLVQERLAACVNILPALTSVYEWKGELCQEEESMLIIKSTRELFQRLEARLKQLHPYEVAEIIALPIEVGHKPYLDWIHSQLAEVPIEAGKET
ncbi:MAG TPA: divalent-cation tolerance protein CutA [Planktothrix sp.]|jgi:periplasmic divalent cation tolerance protein